MTKEELIKNCGKLDSMDKIYSIELSNEISEKDPSGNIISSSYFGTRFSDTECFLRFNYEFELPLSKFSEQNQKIIIEKLEDELEARKTMTKDDFDLMINTMDLLNMNAKLRIGGRKINTSGKSIDDLINKYFVGIDEENLGYEILRSDEPGIAKVFKDLNKYSYNSEDSSSEWTTINGIKVLLIHIVADYGPESVAFIYSDGSSLRGYYPLKGNTILPEMKSTFAEVYEDEWEEILENRKGHDSFSNGELLGLGRYLSGGYYDFWVTPNLDACIEDFKNRIEII